jgi:3-hydroxybutyryl-CoA dehydrogenase
MGSGIAYVASIVAKKSVLVYDVNSEQLSKAKNYIDGIAAKEVTKNKLSSEAAQEGLSRISYSSSYDELIAGSGELLIEAATENSSLKLAIFKQLAEKLANKQTILASNTSSISITKIAGATGKAAERVIGMHFMNPVPIMKLVEVIPGLQTNQQTIQTILQLAAEMNKTTTISKDIPGFIANRLLMPYLNEAIYALQEGIASIEHIDTTMKLGTGAHNLISYSHNN